MHSVENDKKQQIWPFLLSQNCSKFGKINRPWPRFNLFWRLWGYTYAYQISCHSFLHSVLQKMLRTHKFDPFTKFFGLCDLEIWQMTLQIWEPPAVGVSNDAMKYDVNQWRNMPTEAGTDGQTDRQIDRQSVYRAPYHSWKCSCKITNLMD